MSNSFQEIHECKAGFHDLIEIYRARLSPEEDEVVRWCKRCGSIVVDEEIGSVTYKGKVLPMMSPVAINHIQIYYS